MAFSQSLPFVHAHAAVYFLGRHALGPTRSTVPGAVTLPAIPGRRSAPVCGASPH